MTDIVFENCNKCDFCSALNPTWEYPARSYQVKTLDLPMKVNSVESWAACDACHDLIQADNWQGLAERTVETFSAKTNVPIPIEFMRAVQREFRANWIGPARKVNWADRKEKQS